MKFPIFMLLINLLVLIKSELILLINEKNNFASCIGTGNDANSSLAWFENEEPSLKTPIQIYENDYTNETETWKIGNSFEFNMGTILDERWEEFETIQLRSNRPHKIFSETIKYLPLSVYLEDDITLSFFCDELTHSTKLLLQKFKRETFGSDVNTIIINLPYKTWSHVNLIFHNSTIIAEVNNEAFTFAMVRSELVNIIKICSNRSFLKVHAYTFKYTTAGSNSGTLYSFQEKNPYLSLFVSICPNCKMGINFGTENKFDFINDKTMQVWKKIVHKINYQKVNMQVWTEKHVESKHDTIFAIHSLKTFLKADFRNSTIKELKNSKNISCGNLSNKSYVTVTNNTKKNKKCKIGYFGQHCNITFEVSPYSKICEETYQCYCYWGFKGEACDKACDNGNWGINCSYKCGHCADSRYCNKSNGLCTKCKSGYFGKYCLLENHTVSISVEDYSYTWVQLSFNNAKQLNNHSTICQYNEIGKSENWMEIGTKRNDTFYYCNITDLKPGKGYQIEVITMNYTETYFYEKIGSLNQTTKCNELNTSNFQLYQHNRNIEMFLEPENYWCLNESIIVTSSNGQSFKLINFPIKFTNVLHCHEYNLTFSKKFSNIIYRTHPVAVLHDFNQSNGKITWRICNNTILEDYSIKYQVSNYAYCNKNRVFVSPKEAKLRNRTAIFENLRPYTNYKYYIFPANKTDHVIYYGYFFTSSDDISTDELPKNVSFENESIVITQCDCSKLKGNITYILHINCTEKWCSEEAVTKEIQYDFHSSKVFIKTEDFKYAFSKYSVDVTISRNSSLPSLRYSNRINFKTRPSKPSEVKNVTEYSSNSTTVWIRWLPPYPPTGKILDYNISITSSKKNNVNKSIEDCKFWPGFACFQVEVPEENTTIGIRALNENVNEEGEEACITLSRREDLSKLEDLQAKFESSAMIVMWKAPYYLNGATSFVLYVSVIQSDYNEQDQNNTIPLENITTCGIYVCVKVKSNFGTKYKIAVSLKRKYEGPQKTIHIITPPPKPIFSLRPYIDHCEIDSCKLIFPTLKNFSNNCTIYVFTSRPESKEQFTNFNKLLPEDLSKFLNVNSSLYLEPRQYKPSDSSLTINISGLGHSTQNNNLTILVLNEFCGKYNWTFYYPNLITNTEISTIIMVSIACVIAFIFVIVIFIILCWIRSRRSAKRNRNASKTSCSNSKVDEEHSENLLMHNRRKAQKVDKKNKIVVNKVLPSNKISKKNFENYLKNCSKELSKEHKSIEPVNEQFSAVESKKSRNASKNRPSKYYAYDHTRVILKNHPTNYIHANFINGFGKENKYIATQSPKTNTINDFWHMVWQEQVEYIIVLLDYNNIDSIKYIQYWPNERETITFDNLTISNNRTEMKTNYYINYLKIECAEECRLVKHFHFLDWPDNGIPLYPNSLIPFLEDIRGIEFYNQPLVVHCSNGTGNTGTFILCDTALDMIEQNDSVDFLNILAKMRNQRMGVIEDTNQYILCHYLVYEYTFARDYFLLPSEMFSKAKYKKFIQSNTVKDVVKYLNKTNWKCRVLEIISADVLPPLDVEINYVCVNNFKSSNIFLLMKCPIKKQVEHFWKLLWHYDVQLVVYLNDIDNKRIVETTVWPEENTKQYISNVGEIECSNESEVNLLTVKITKEQERKQIKFLSVKNGWSTSCLTPITPKFLLDIQEDVYNLSNSCKSPIVIMCHDGVTACGLFIASALLIKKIKVENTIDVVSAVQHSQIQCKKFVEHEKQVEFLYKTAFEYISTKDMYISI